MQKSMAITQMEQQIEALPPIEQIMMLERIVRHLKRVVLAQPATTAPRTESKHLTEKLNNVYGTESSHLDAHLGNAQFATIGRDEW